MKHHRRLFLPRFRHQIQVLPLIPDGLTPTLAFFGEGWRIGEPWDGKPKKTAPVVFIEPPDSEVAVKQVA